MSERNDRYIMLVGTTFGSILGFCKGSAPPKGGRLELTHAVFVQQDNTFVPIGGLDALATEYAALEEVVTYLNPDSYVMATVFPPDRRSPLVNKFLDYWDPEWDAAGK